MCCKLPVAAVAAADVAVVLVAAAAASHVVAGDLRQVLECGRGRHRSGRRAERHEGGLSGGGGGCQVERGCRRVGMHPLGAQVLAVLSAQLVRGRVHRPRRPRTAHRPAPTAAAHRRRPARGRSGGGRGRVEAHGVGVRAGLIIARNCGHRRAVHQHGSNKNRCLGSLADYILC